MQPNHPGEVELYASFMKHFGPTFRHAGLRVQFHYNQEPGIHFRAEPPLEFAEAILRGVQHGLDRYFPEFPANGSVWITEVSVHEVYSSSAAFYQAGLLVIRQALTLIEITESEPS